jgi:release factor glutamine methyltransferase
MTEVWTVERLLSWMTQDLRTLGVASPRLDAELLICHALACTRVRLYMDLQRPLTRDELSAVRALLVRRRRREPVAYLRGAKEFYLHEFEVNCDVLVPRPETEVLVDRALDALPQSASRALDLCTGSGVIAITLALQRPSLCVDATDLSEPALAVAARNVERHQVGARVVLHHGDLFAALRERIRYDLIVANPPYIADEDWASLAPEITAHEPRLALTTGEGGLAVLRRIFDEAADWLVPGGTVLCEVGEGQASTVLGWLRAGSRYKAVAEHKDLAGIGRVVEARTVDQP